MKRNLIIGSTLIGGIFDLLSLIAKVAILVGLALYLSIAYDGYDYQLRTRGYE